MTAFLFWNLNRKPLEASIARLAWRHEIDVIMLAECPVSPNALLMALNEPGRPGYHYARGHCEKIRIFTRFLPEYIAAKYEDHRTTMRHLTIPAATDILLVVTHLPSKTHWSQSSQAAECTVLADNIRRVEEQVGHSRTALVGDLNVNPFEAGAVNANALHGVMCRRIAGRGKRTVQGREYPFFYNPMWSLLGDASPGPPGTYYYAAAEHTVFFWNTFDQLLIRPDLLGMFGQGDLQIIQSDGTDSFLSSDGLPHAQVASDHLPVFFRLTL